MREILCDKENKTRKKKENKGHRTFEKNRR